MLVLQCELDEVGIHAYCTCVCVCVFVCVCVCVYVCVCVCVCVCVFVSDLYVEILLEWLVFALSI